MNLIKKTPVYLALHQRISSFRNDSCLTRSQNKEKLCVELKVQHVEVNLSATCEYTETTGGQCHPLFVQMKAAL